MRNTFFYLKDIYEKSIFSKFSVEGQAEPVDSEANISDENQTLEEVEKNARDLADKSNDKALTSALDEAKENFEGEKGKIISETKKQTAELSEEISSQSGEKMMNLNNSELANITEQDLEKNPDLLKTIEKIDGATGTFGRKLDREKILKLVNLGSLKNILNNPNNSIDQIYSGIQTTINKIGNGKYTPFNINEMENFLKNQGYSTKKSFFDWGMGGEEAVAIVNILKGVKETQSKISSASFGEKLKILADYDMNGTLEDKSNFNLFENETFESIKDEKTFKNFITNLGLDVSDFNSKMSVNYFSAREEFKTAISRFIEMNGTSPNQLLLPKEMFDKTMDYLSQKNANESVGVEKAISKNLDEAIKKSGVDVSSEVRKQAIGLMLGAVNGAGYSTDSIGKKVSEMSGGLLNNVGVGFVDGKIGLVIGGTKDFGDRLSISAGASNFIPFISATGTLIKGGQDKESKSTMFSKDMKMTGSLDATVGVSAGVVGGGISLNKIDEQTSRGIREMVKNMSSALDKAFQEPIKNFEDFSKETGMQNNQENRVAYKKLMGAFNSYGKKDVVNFKRGIMRAYQNELYKNAEGFKLTGLSLGIIGPIVALGVSGEKITQSYKEKDIKDMDNFIKSIIESKKSEPGRLVENSTEKNLSNFDVKALENVNKLGKTISDMIEYKDIQKLGKLETSIHNLLNGRGNLEETWRDFSTEMKKLGKNISILGSPSSDEKLLILQSVGINLMKKEGLRISHNGTVDINKTLAEYDRVHSREKYFGKIFQKELSLMAGSIDSARNEYYSKFGKYEGYQIGQVPVDGGVGFTGVEIGTGKGKINTLNPYVASHIATFDGVPGKVEITNVSREGVAQMVDKLPNHLIEPLIAQLEANGYTFTEGNKINQMKKIIVDGKAGEITIDKNIYFSKAAECLNDMVLMDFKLKYKNQTITPGENFDIKFMRANVAENSVTNLGVGISVDRTKKPPTPETEVGSKPDEVQNNKGTDLSGNPGYEKVTDGTVEMGPGPNGDIDWNN